VPHDVVGRRRGDPVATFADPKMARDLLGWSAERGLDEIVRSAYDWHRRSV
jgi:UDP-glucose 4-epimerase